MMHGILRLSNQPGKNLGPASLTSEILRNICLELFIKAEKAWQLCVHPE